MELQENFVCPTLASWGWFLCGGEGHLANRLGSWFGMNTKLLRGVIGPIFSLNDYLNTVFDNVVGLQWQLQNNPSTGKVWFKNRPFYSCVWKRGSGWPCFDTNLPALLCKSSYSYANQYFSRTISITKQRRFVSKQGHPQPRFHP